MDHVYDVLGITAEMRKRSTSSSYVVHHLVLYYTKGTPVYTILSDEKLHCDDAASGERSGRERDAAAAEREVHVPGRVARPVVVA